MSDVQCTRKEPGKPRQLESPPSCRLHFSFCLGQPADWSMDRPSTGRWQTSRYTELQNTCFSCVKAHDNWQEDRIIYLKWAQHVILALQRSMGDMPASHEPRCSVARSQARCMLRNFPMLSLQICIRMLADEAKRSEGGIQCHQSRVGRKNGHGSRICVQAPRKHGPRKYVVHWKFGWTGRCMPGESHNFCGWRHALDKQSLFSAIYTLYSPLVIHDAWMSWRVVKKLSCACLHRIFN